MLGPGGGVSVGPMGKFIGEKKLDFLDEERGRPNFDDKYFKFFHPIYYI